MKFEYWFPTVTATHFVSEEAKIATKNKIDSWINSGESLAYLEMCKEDNLYTSYFKWHDTLGDINLNELTAEILQAGAEFAQHHGLSVGPEALKVDSWINFFNPGQSEQQHNHYGNFISGVYYVSAPPGAGAYRFYDPAVQKTMWKGIHLHGSQPGMTTQSSGQFIPQEGMMILFPSWLEHCVLANKSDQTRISLAFNINVK